MIIDSMRFCMYCALQRLPVGKGKQVRHEVKSSRLGDHLITDPLEQLLSTSEHPRCDDVAVTRGDFPPKVLQGHAVERIYRSSSCLKLANMLSI